MREFVLLDFETTSEHPFSGAVVEVAAIRFLDGHAVDQFTALVTPRVPVEPGALAVHGLSTAYLEAEGDDAASVFRRLARFIGDLPLVAHNGLDFDFPYLATELGRWGVPVGRNPLVDTLDLAEKYLVHKVPSFSLAVLCNALQIENLKAHSALSDAKALEGVLVAIQNEARGADLWRDCGSHVLDDLIKLPRGFRLLEEAMAGGKALEIVYAGGSKPPRQRWISPRYVAVGRKEQYVYALCHDDQFDKLFRLDRIQQLLRVK